MITSIRINTGKYIVLLCGPVQYGVCIVLPGFEKKNERSLIGFVLNDDAGNRVVRRKRNAGNIHGALARFVFMSLLKKLDVISVLLNNGT